MIRRTIFALVIATGFFAGCKRNPPEQVAAAHQAAEAYCACVKRLFGVPVDQLAARFADVTTRECEAERTAFGAAWELLPIRGQDPAADKVFALQSSCARELSDLRMKYSPE